MDITDIDKLRHDIVKFRNNKNITQEEFGKLIGLSKNTVYSYENDGVIPKSKMAVIKRTIYGDENAPVLNEPATEYKMPFKNEVSIIPESKYQLVEFADLSSSAGELGGADVSQLTEKHTRLVPRQYDNGLYLVIKISGESMNDGTSRALHDGDEVLVKLVEFGNGYVLPIRQKLFVITSSEGNVIKQITEVNKDEGYIVCHSFNPAFDDYILHIKDIFQFFEVIMIINRPINLM